MLSSTKIVKKKELVHLDNKNQHGNILIEVYSKNIASLLFAFLLLQFS